MSNQEWSDDEEDNINPQPDRMFPPSDSESDEDFSEFNRLVLTKVKEDNYSFFKSNDSNNDNNPKKKYKIKEKKDNKINIDWNNLEEDNKEKKWQSKRMNDRKLKEGKIKNVRKFNPRLPIPSKKLNKDKKKNIVKQININNEEFPEL